MKNALIDRIGCGLGAKRLNTTLKISKYFELYACKGYSTIWGSNTRTQSHIAALVNGASSSHLEYDSHDSMIPSTIALGEEYAVNGETILQSIKIGYVTCSILNLQSRGKRDALASIYIGVYFLCCLLKCPRFVKRRDSQFHKYSCMPQPSITF